jgi:hypothetical protein
MTIKYNDICAPVPLAYFFFISKSPTKRKYKFAYLEDTVEEAKSKE